MTVPFQVEDAMTRLRHTVTSVTDSPSGRWYWIDGKRWEAGRFNVIKS